MPNYTITLTVTEQKAMNIAADVDEWITSGNQPCSYCCRQIVSLNTAHCNANGIAIGVGVTAQIEQAYNLGIVTTAAAHNAAAAEKHLSN